MDFQIFSSREGFITLAALVRFLIGMGADMYQHFVASIEAFVVSGTTLPAAVEEASGATGGMAATHMVGELLQGVEGEATGMPIATNFRRFGCVLDDGSCSDWFWGNFNTR